MSGATRYGENVDVGNDPVWQSDTRHSLVSHAGDGGAQHEPKPSADRKRPAASEDRIAYARKRSATACHVCRLRKTKCDNQRPKCSACETLNVECLYQDKKSDDSSSDSGSLAILGRINYAIHLLESQSNKLSTLANQQSPQYPIATPSTSNILDNTPVSSDTNNGVDFLNNDATTLIEALSVSANCSSARVLEWPIFEGKIDIAHVNAYFWEPKKPLTPELSPASATSVKSDASCRTSRLGRGLREEDVVTLVREFVQKVHIKNPVLDPLILMEMARRVAEEGFKWDDSSCLVMIACALANLASDFSLLKPSSSECSYMDAKDYPTAEQYYTGARKRMGLLDDSVLTAQCVFLIGVYEMYSLRPLKAWFSFSTACTVFQTYLHSSSRSNLSRSARRMEQRLYWSCLKSECEMRDEINLPPSGLAKVNYPDVFPSPPGDTPQSEEVETTRITDQLEHEFQRSWYYYLSEIASRRIANRITHTLHSAIHESWLSASSKQLQRIAEELDAQIMQWYEHLPDAFGDGSLTGPPDELNYVLKARFLDLRERIWRPFLFIVIHTPNREAEDSQNLEYAARALYLVFQHIEEMTIKHRHHGSWYNARQGFTKALLILAAAKSRRIPLREDWFSYIELVQNELKYWEEEAPDLRMARLALATFLADI